MRPVNQCVPSLKGADGIDTLGCRFISAGFVIATGQVAQAVEQRPEKPCVGGSNPPLATNYRYENAPQPS